jgi:hypothetical protein
MRPSIADDGGEDELDPHVETGNEEWIWKAISGLVEHPFVV